MNETSISQAVNSWQHSTMQPVRGQMKRCALALAYIVTAGTVRLFLELQRRVS